MNHIFGSESFFGINKLLVRKTDLGIKAFLGKIALLEKIALLAKIALLIKIALKTAFLEIDRYLGINSLGKCNLRNKCVDSTSTFFCTNKRNNKRSTH